MSPKLPSALLLVLAVALPAAPARALPEFPAVISNELQLSYQPPCSVCHVTNKVGAPTVATPFAYALRERGLTGEKSLPGALTRLADDQADSDGDGAPDVVELRNGTDPNSKANASLIDVADPNFGCATLPPRKDAGLLRGFWLGMAAVVLALSRRFRAALR